MNYYLGWKYFQRENLWLKWLPIYVLLLESIIPIRLTVLPFLFLRTIFCEYNSMLPCTIKNIQMTNFRLVDCVRTNNFMLIIAGTIIHLLVSGLVISSLILIKGKYDLSLLYDFIPLLLYSIVFGNMNIYVKFSNFRTHPIFLSIVHFVFLLLVYFLSKYSVQMYWLITFFFLIGIFATYKMLQDYD